MASPTWQLSCSTPLADVASVSHASHVQALGAMAGRLHSPSRCPDHWYRSCPPLPQHTGLAMWQGGGPRTGHQLCCNCKTARLHKPSGVLWGD